MFNETCAYCNVLFTSPCAVEVVNLGNLFYTVSPGFRTTYCGLCALDVIGKPGARLVTHELICPTCPNYVRCLTPCFIEEGHYP